MPSGEGRRCEASAAFRATAVVKSQRRSLSSRHNNRPQTVSPPTNSTWRRLPVPSPAGTPRVGFSWFIWWILGGSSSDSRFSSFPVCLWSLTDSFLLLCPRQADGWKMETLLTDKRTITHARAELFYIFQLTVCFFLPTKCSLQGSALLQSLKRRAWLDPEEMEPAVCCNPPCPPRVHPVTPSPCRPQLWK